MEFSNLFTSIFQKNGLDRYINEQNIRSFEKLTEIMLETNKSMNITAITDIEKIISLHYADCVKVAEYIPANAKVLDVGCGGGYPILPLAIVRPDLDITGLDSTEKKVKYVQQTGDALGLRVHTISARAEDASKQIEYREVYDVVISRAVARLNILNELCLPFTKVGGMFLSMKGLAGQEEYYEAEIGIERLGGREEQTLQYDLNLMDNSEKRTLIVIRKEYKTPREFPRVFGAIKKRPL